MRINFRRRESESGDEDAVGLDIAVEELCHVRKDIVMKKIQ